MKHISRSMLLALIVAIFVTGIGCNQEDNSQLTNETNNLSQENQKLKKENEELRSTINKLKESEKIYLDSQEARLQKLYKDYSWLEKFRISPNWDKVIISRKNGTADSVITVTDKEILNTVSYMLYIESEFSQDAFKGIFPEDGSYTYKVALGNDTFTFYVTEDIIEFDNLPHRYFKVRGKISNIGKALLEKPDQFPTESIHVKLAQSGLMMGEIMNHFCFTPPFKGTVYKFIQTPKKAVDKPTQQPIEVIERLAFYYFGEKIYMTFYRNYIQINDSDKEYWYELDDKDIFSLTRNLAAN